MQTVAKDEQRPRGAKANPEFHHVIAERVPGDWGLGDPVGDRVGEGYEIVKEAGRRVTMRIPFAQHQAEMDQVHEIANSRIAARATPDIVGGPIASVTATNHVGKGIDAKELAAGMREAEEFMSGVAERSDLDG